MTLGGALNHSFVCDLQQLNTTLATYSATLRIIITEVSGMSRASKTFCAKIAV
jgi:hypothetical protein